MKYWPAIQFPDLSQFVDLEPQEWRKGQVFWRKDFAQISEFSSPSPKGPTAFYKGNLTPGERKQPDFLESIEYWVRIDADSRRLRSNVAFQLK